METPELLAVKSRELLTDQLASVDSNNAKAGTITAVSALFVPFSFSVFDKIATTPVWICIFFVPIILNLVGIYYLLSAMRPKSLFHGIGFNEMDELLNKEAEDVYLFEISINRGSFNDNRKPIKKQNNCIKIGLQMIYTSAIALTLIFFVNLITTKPNNMTDNNQSSNTSSGNNNNQNSGGNSVGTSRQIPSTNSGQRSVIEKGGNPKGDVLKK
ncbi:hypothetical protein [Chryseobacterium taichungense]|uniref:hypothetical protein n=1 Tax=Chryseobacterium taichungense TaxID=295069 RepID=UPI0028A980B1|nr:hypothetical protein [Chryseobacterium taichungense]